MTRGKTFNDMNVKHEDGDKHGMNMYGFSKYLKYIKRAYQPPVHLPGKCT